MFDAVTREFGNPNVDAITINLELNTFFGRHHSLHGEHELTNKSRRNFMAAFNYSHHEPLLVALPDRQLSEQGKALELWAFAGAILVRPYRPQKRGVKKYYVFRECPVGMGFNYDEASGQVLRAWLNIDRRHSGEAITSDSAYAIVMAVKELGKRTLENVDFFDAARSAFNSVRSPQNFRPLLIGFDPTKISPAVT